MKTPNNPIIFVMYTVIPYDIGFSIFQTVFQFSPHTLKCNWSYLCFGFLYPNFKFCTFIIIIISL